MFPKDKQQLELWQFIRRNGTVDRFYRLPGQDKTAIEMVKYLDPGNNGSSLILLGKI